MGASLLGAAPVSVTLPQEGIGQESPNFGLPLEWSTAKKRPLGGMFGFFFGAQINLYSKGGSAYPLFIPLLQFISDSVSLHSR